MKPRTEWSDLPPGVRETVESRVGRVLRVEPVPDGLTCLMAARLTTATGRVFVKGVPAEDADGREAQRLEAAVNPLLGDVGSRLLHQVVADGWDVLLFEHVDGRHADLSHGSPDVALVAGALHRADGLRAGTVPLPALTDRYAPFLDPAEAALLDGDYLLHTDTNPHNLLISDGRAHIVDWAMAATGPAWVDVAYTAVRLMEADWTGAQAVEWAGQFPAWRAADPAAVATFVAAVCRDWDAHLGPRDARFSNARYAALLNVASLAR